MSYKTAWVEDVKGSSTGEYMEYEFAPESARVHEVRIANGYVKSEKAFKEMRSLKGWIHIRRLASPSFTIGKMLSPQLICLTTR